MKSLCPLSRFVLIGHGQRTASARALSSRPMRSVQYSQPKVSKEVGAAVKGAVRPFPAQIKPAPSESELVAEVQPLHCTKHISFSSPFSDFMAVHDDELLHHEHKEKTREHHCTRHISFSSPFSDFMAVHEREHLHLDAPVPVSSLEHCVKHISFSSPFSDFSAPHEAELHHLEHGEKSREKHCVKHISFSSPFSDFAMAHEHHLHEDTSKSSLGFSSSSA